MESLLRASHGDCAGSAESADSASLLSQWGQTVLDEVAQATNKCLGVKRHHTWEEFEAATRAAEQALESRWPGLRRGAWLWVPELMQHVYRLLKTDTGALVINHALTSLLYTRFTEDADALRLGSAIEALARRLLAARVSCAPFFPRNGHACAAAVPTLRRLCADCRPVEAEAGATPARWDAATDGRTFSWSVTLGSSRRWYLLPSFERPFCMRFFFVADAPFVLEAGGQRLSPPARVGGGRAGHRPLFALLAGVSQYSIVRASLEPDAPEAVATLTVYCLQHAQSAELVAVLRPSPLCPQGGMCQAAFKRHVAARAVPAGRRARWRRDDFTNVCRVSAVAAPAPIDREAAMHP